MPIAVRTYPPDVIRSAGVNLTSRPLFSRVITPLTGIASMLERTEIPLCAEVKLTLSVNTRTMGVFTGMGPPSTLVSTSAGGVVSLTIVGPGASSSPQPRRYTHRPMIRKRVRCFIMYFLLFLQHIT